MRPPMRNSTSSMKRRASRRNRDWVARRCPTVPPTSWSKFRRGIRITPRTLIPDRVPWPVIPVSQVASQKNAFHGSHFTSHGSRNPRSNMPATFDWDNTEDIAIALTEKYPDTDPLTVRFTDMHKRITEMPGFSGNPKTSNEGKLEAIQMAWHEEFQDRQSCPASD